MHILFRIQSWLRYQLKAVNEHAIHPPFAFDFYTRIVKAKKYPPHAKAIENLRKSLRKSKEVIKIEDFGAGSSLGSSHNRSIASIARYSASEAEVSALLWRIAQNFESPHIIELGTSLGINTLYLSQHPKARIATFEGSSALVDQAQTHFQEFKAHGITTVSGNIDDTLGVYLEKSAPVDVVFFDANHRLEPTLRYFHQCLAQSSENSIFVFDDIYWSPEMQEAWQQICAHPAVSLSMDLYKIGIVHLRPLLKKQHYVLRF
ncbi:class I SAM-dependent methyltransferase [Cytophagales bacterium LB-30]|uniref:Class I SAM-dependent methyltransferase n=1 Tax=Shiella aurantiaca TaxID=3058365 RepID=A0ABT8F464_9BACT|nr:class I SAM-dependent methyltransferase [Shiella aurantiaca]MDN4165252.1 class I SAM-dependent methyltransferase [Shiella aurantiaca]